MKTRQRFLRPTRFAPLGVREWLAEDSGRVMQFLVRSKGYRWPADPEP